MKRLYICDIIGDGLTPSTAFRPAINDIVDPETGLRAFNVNSVIETDENGQPTKTWCLVNAAGKNHDLVKGNTAIDSLSDHPPTVKLSSMTTAEKNKMTAKLMARQIDISQFSNADGMRDIIEYIGKQHSASFSYDNFDVAE